MDIKKVLAVTAAVVGTSAMAIESSVVGYASAELQEYGLTAGACFIPVQGNTFDLTQLRITGYEEATEGDVYIQTLDYAGRTVATYSYYDVPGELTGWLDEYDNEIAENEVTFQAGEGLWTFSNADGFGFQSAGQVPTSPVAVTLQQYGLSVANPTPINVDLTDTYIGGYEEATEGDVYIQTLDYAGRTVATYSYYDVPGELTGWLDEYDNEVSKGDVVLKPGEGIWTFSADDGFTFVFPGVTL